MKQPRIKTLRDLLDLPLTPEVDGMVRIWLDAESEMAAGHATGTDASEDRYSVLEGPVSSLRRHVVLQLSATRSQTVFDAVARLGIWRSQGARLLDRKELDALAENAIEDMIVLARNCALNKRKRFDLPE